MKVSNIGIILLTLMVTTKYFISLNTMTHKDGSLSGGLVIDYTAVQKELLGLQTPSPITPLLAYNSINPVADQQNTEAGFKTTSTTRPMVQTPVSSGYIVNEAEVLKGPAPMEYGNTLVVYNPSNPVIAEMSTQFADPEDSEPLDQGNTLVDEMQMMMPRR